MSLNEERVYKHDLINAQMINAGQYRREIAESGDNTYIAYAIDPEAKTTDAVWQVARIDADGSLRFAGATRRFIHQADDMASLDYSLPA